jgi:hypothetical protein
LCPPFKDPPERSVRFVGSACLRKPDRLVATVPGTRSAEPSVSITDTVAEVPERLLPRARPTGTSERCPTSICPRVRGHPTAGIGAPYPSIGIDQYYSDAMF